MKLRVSEVVEICAVSSGLHTITGEERTCASKATLIGACKSIPQEYPNIVCRSVDVVLQEWSSRYRGKAGAGSHLSELETECTNPVVAYRGGQRWAQIFEPIRLDESTDVIPALRRNGVYFITGGLGNIGLALAEYLAWAARARLVLVGRSEFPDKEDWYKWLRTHDPEDETSIRIGRLQEIETLGSEVLVIRADVADLSAMESALDQACKRFGRIHGVIHGAGNIGAEAFFAIDEADRGRCERQFQSKVRGLMWFWSRCSVTRISISSCCFSSISSVLAGLGYIAYSAANRSSWMRLRTDAIKRGRSRGSASTGIRGISGRTRLRRPGVSRHECGRRCGSFPPNFVRRVVAASCSLCRGPCRRIDQWISFRVRPGGSRSKREAVGPDCTRGRSWRILISLREAIWSEQSPRSGSRP